MSSLEDLLREAEEVRKYYRIAIDEAEKARLRNRYEEIDKAIQALKVSTESPKIEKPKPKKRVSLRKKDSLEGAAADLLALCESVTADGVLSDLEIDHLREWLGRNASSDLPAVKFLRDIVEIVLQDKQITGEERKQIYKAIETVLPPDIRKYVVQKRRIVEALEKEKEKQERKARRAAETERLRADRQASAPVLDADFMVAGVSYEGRDRVVRRHVRAGDSVYFVRDPANEYSQFATEIRAANGKQIGFVPEEWAEEIAPLLDSGHQYRATVKKVLTGGRTHIPVIVAGIFEPDVKLEGLNKAASTSTSWTSCGCAILIIAACFWFFYVLFG